MSRGETERRVESLSKLIEEASALALVGAKQYGVRVSMEFDPAADLVLVDRVQVEMVLNNLVANAVEAIASADGAARDISIEAAPHDPGFVLVAVRDSGPGLAPAIMERLFVPFSTTKPSGSGLGLSISRSIRKCARSGPSRSSTASSASSHSCVSSASGSFAAGNCGSADMARGALK